MVDPRRLRALRLDHQRAVPLRPHPYDNLGGGPFEVMACSGLFAAGSVLTSVLTSVAPILRSLLRNFS
jgi:hypothetical protein